jgi:hypothetical protein
LTQPEDDSVNPFFFRKQGQMVNYLVHRTDIREKWNRGDPLREMFRQGYFNIVAAPANGAEQLSFQTQGKTITEHCLFQVFKVLFSPAILHYQ